MGIYYLLCVFLWRAFKHIENNWLINPNNETLSELLGSPLGKQNTEWPLDNMDTARDK